MWLLLQLKKKQALRLDGGRLPLFGAPRLAGTLRAPASLAHAQRSNGAATAVMASRGSPRDAPSNAWTMHILFVLLQMLLLLLMLGTGLHAAVSLAA